MRFRKRHKGVSLIVEFSTYTSADWEVSKDNEV